MLFVDRNRDIEMLRKNKVNIFNCCRNKTL